MSITRAATRRGSGFGLAVPAILLLLAFFVVPVDRALLSLLGALVLNLIVGLNHKPGRYVGFS